MVVLLLNITESTPHSFGLVNDTIGNGFTIAIWVKLSEQPLSEVAKSSTLKVSAVK